MCCTIATVGYRRGKTMVASKYNVFIQINEQKFIFNLASRCLLGSNDELVEFLKGRNTDIVLSDDEEKSLYDNGIIVDSHELEVSRLKGNIRTLKYDRTQMAAFISTTSACNLSCTYCYQDCRKEKGKKKYINMAKWEILLKYFTDEIEKNGTKIFTVSIFGGEPMTNDAMCKHMLQDLKNLENIFPKLQVKCNMITNGTLFTKENIGFYLKNLENIQITLDGLKEINDKLRIYPDGKGSFDEIIEAIKLFKEHRKNENESTLCLRVNVNKDTVKRARELVDFLIDEDLVKGITAINFHEIFGTQGDVIKDGSDLNDNDVELAKEIVGLNYYLIEKGIKVYKDLGGPCIGKMMNGYTVDEELNVYACPGLLYSEVHGKIDDSVKMNINSHRWYDFYLSESECVNHCKYAPVCYGGCTWAKGENERDCMKSIYDATLVDKLKAYIISQYM